MHMLDRRFRRARQMLWPLRRSTDPPDDEFKETLVGWFAAEADAQQQPEEARILWLNRLRNRDLDRLERARRAVPAGDNAVKIENDLEFPL